MALRHSGRTLSVGELSGGKCSNIEQLHKKPFPYIIFKIAFENEIQSNPSRLDLNPQLQFFMLRVSANHNGIST